MVYEYSFAQNVSMTNSFDVAQQRINFNNKPIDKLS